MKVRLVDTNEVKDYPKRKALDLIASGRAVLIKENSTESLAHDALNEAKKRDGIEE